MSNIDGMRRNLAQYDMILGFLDPGIFTDMKLTMENSAFDFTLGVELTREVWPAIAIILETKANKLKQKLGVADV